MKWKILFLLTFLILGTFLAHLSCDDSLLLDTIKYLNRPQQQITNVQVVSINRLEVSISFDVDQNSFTTEDIQIVDSQGNIVEVIDIQFESGNSSKVILETEFLTPDTRYTITINNIHSTTTQTTPRGGLQFNFITTGFPDNTPPNLLSYCILSEDDVCIDYDSGWSNPDPGLIYPFTGIQLTFGEAMEPATVQLNLAIKINESEIHFNDGIWSNFKQTVIFNVEDDYLRKRASISLSNEAKDARGNPLTNPIEGIEFSIGELPGSDAFESNNNFGEAKSIELNTLYFATITPESDEDYFSITLTGDTPYLLTVDGIPDGCDYELEVYFAPDSGSQVSSLIAYSVDYEKYLFIPELSGDHTYYLRIFSNSGSSSEFYNFIVIEYNLDQAILFNTTEINTSNMDSVSISIIGGESTYTYSFDVVSDGSKNGTTGTQNSFGLFGTGDVTIDVSDLYDGTLRIENFTLNDGAQTTDPMDGLNTAVKYSGDKQSPTNANWLPTTGIIEQGPNIQTTFSEPMDQSTVENVGNYSINISEVTIESISYNPDTYVATFTIKYTDTDGSETYRITPLNLIEDMAGNPLDPTASPTYTTLATHKLVPVGVYNTPGNAKAIHGHGLYAYIADGSGGLQIIEISNPSSPSYTGNLSMTDATSVFIEDEGSGLVYAYCSDDDTFQIVDASTPSSPSQIEQVFIGDTTYDIIKRGNFAYTCNTGGAILTYNVSEKSSPAYQTNDPVTAIDLFSYNDILYSAGGDALNTFGLTNPSDPLPIGNIGVSGATGIYVAGTIAYVTSPTIGLRMFNIVTPSSPIQMGTITLADANRVFVQGDFAYVTRLNSGVSVVDVSDPSNPGLKTTYDTIGTANDVYVIGQYAYVADGTNGLQILEVVTPSTPIHKSSITKGTTVWAVAVQGNYAYIAASINGLLIDNISDPASPAPVGSCLTQEAREVVVEGDYAYVADTNGGLKIINIQNPASPWVEGSISPGGSIHSVYVQNQYAYLTNVTSLIIIDISAKDNPQVEGTRNTPGSARDVVVEGNYAYVADTGTGGVQIIDVSTPSSPSIIGNYDTAGGAIGVAKSGDYLYVADTYNGIVVLDVRTPSSPVYKTNLKSFYAFRIAISGNYAYVADYYEGFKVIDISNPELLTVETGYNKSNEVRDIYYNNGYVYTAETSDGYSIYDVSYF